MLRTLLSILPWLTLLGCTPDIAPAAAPLLERPNVLLIVADDLGWADLNCYGSPLIESPNLDRLARNGLQFMQGYAAAPVGCPSRASIQTGIHPARLGLTDYPHRYTDHPEWALVPPRTPEGLDLEHTTLGDMAKGVGYRTAHVGKWHLGGGEFHPSKQGYGLTYAGGRHGAATSFYYPFFAGEPFPDLLTDAQEGDYLTDILTDKTLSIMDAWADEPWLISLNFYAPHAPIEGRKDWVKHYKDLIDSTHYRPFPEPEYAAMVSTLDENVGRILNRLEERGELDNTLILFVSDNGGLHVKEILDFDRHTPPTDNGILRAGKGYVYEGGIRVPFILHYPNAMQEQDATRTPVVTYDIMPTIAAAIGNERAYGGTDGVNLLPLLAGQDIPERTLYWHFPHYSPQGGRPAAAARRGDFKLYLDYESDSTSYYNLAAQPSERLRLAVPPTDGPTIMSLWEWKREVGAKEAERRN